MSIPLTPLGFDGRRTTEILFDFFARDELVPILCVHDFDHVDVMVRNIASQVMFRYISMLQLCNLCALHILSSFCVSSGNCVLPSSLRQQLPVSIRVFDH